MNQSSSRLTFVLGLTLALHASFGCKPKSETGATDDAPAQATQSSQDGAQDTRVAAAQEARTLAEPLIAWLDPSASGVVWARWPPELEVSSIAAVYGLPLRTEQMLAKLPETRTALQTLVPEPKLEDWLAPDGLVMAPAVTSSYYVLYKLTAPRTQVETWLAQADMNKQELEGFAVWFPARAFPWRVVFLEDSVIALVPAREQGSGLAPLTAGRDLPASPMETELLLHLTEQPTSTAQILMGGPLLQFDLNEPLLRAHMQLLPWKDGGFDGEIHLQSEEPSTAMIEALSKRDVTGEPANLHGLIRSVVFAPEPGGVVGRLQIESSDVTKLQISDS